METFGDKLTEMMELLTVLSMEINSDMELFKETLTPTLIMDKPPVFLISEAYKCNQP